MLGMKLCMRLNGIFLQQDISTNTSCRPKEYLTITASIDLMITEHKKRTAKRLLRPSSKISTKAISPMSCDSNKYNQIHCQQIIIVTLQ